MKISFPWVVLAVALGWLSTSLAQGQTGTHVGADTALRAPNSAYNLPSEDRPSELGAESRVSLFREPGGKLVLVVHYPWKVHLKPSIEVRLLGEGEPDDLEIHPMYFRWKYMQRKKKTAVAVFRCQDACENAPTSVPVREEDDTEFEVLGDRNSLGTPAVCVAREVVRKDATARGEAGMQPGALAAFPLLEPWAVNNALLYLDLPEEYFAVAGRMRVWFLRDDRVLWSENVAWPGLRTAGAKRRPSTAASTAKKPPTRPHPVAVPKPRTEPKATPKREPRPRLEPKARPKREPKPRPERKPRTKRPLRKKGGLEPGF